MPWRAGGRCCQFVEDVSPRKLGETKAHFVGLKTDVAWSKRSLTERFKTLIISERFSSSWLLPIQSSFPQRCLLQKTSKKTSHIYLHILVWILENISLQNVTKSSDGWPTSRIHLRVYTHNLRSHKSGCQSLYDSATISISRYCWKALLESPDQAKPLIGRNSGLDTSWLRLVVQALRTGSHP